MWVIEWKGNCNQAHLIHSSNKRTFFQIVLIIGEQTKSVNGKNFNYPINYVELARSGNVEIN